MFLTRRERLPIRLNKDKALRDLLSLLQSDQDNNFDNNLEPVAGYVPDDEVNASPKERLRQPNPNRSSLGTQSSSPQEPGNRTSDNVEYREDDSSPFRLEGEESGERAMTLEQDDTSEIQQPASMSKTTRAITKGPSKRPRDGIQDKDGRTKDQSRERPEEDIAQEEAPRKRACVNQMVDLDSEDDATNVPKEPTNRRPGHISRPLASTADTIHVVVEADEMPSATGTTFTLSEGAATSSESPRDELALSEAAENSSAMADEPRAITSPPRPGSFDDLPGLSTSAELAVARGHMNSRNRMSMRPDASVPLTASTHDADDTDDSHCEELDEIQAEFENTTRRGPQKKRVHNVAFHEEHVCRLQMKLADLETRNSSPNQQLELTRMSLADAARELLRNEETLSTLEKIFSPSIEAFDKEYRGDRLGNVDEDCVDTIDKMNHQLKVAKRAVLANQQARNLELARLERYQEET